MGTAWQQQRRKLGERKREGPHLPALRHSPQAWQGEGSIRSTVHAVLPAHATPLPAGRWHVPACCNSLALLDGGGDARLGLVQQLDKAHHLRQRVKLGACRQCQQPVPRSAHAHDGRAARGRLAVVAAQQPPLLHSSLHAGRAGPGRHVYWCRLGWVVMWPAATRGRQRAGLTRSRSGAGSGGSSAPPAVAGCAATRVACDCRRVRRERGCMHACVHACARLRDWPGGMECIYFAALRSAPPLLKRLPRSTTLNPHHQGKHLSHRNPGAQLAPLTSPDRLRNFLPSSPSTRPKPTWSMRRVRSDGR